MVHKKRQILGIGGLLWDMLPAGRRLGGAPCNFTFHSQFPDTSAYVVSAVGNDRSGREIIKNMEKLGLATSCIAVIKEYPTGTVDVKIDSNGIPKYIIHKQVAWDFIPLTEKVLKLGADADAISFGTLAQRCLTSRNTIREVIKVARNDCLVIYDINLRQNYFNRDIIHQSLELSNILKLNDDELLVLAHILDMDGNEETLALKLIKRYNLKMLILTCGENGSVLYSADNISRVPAIDINIVDTVGAGDAFTAAVTSGILDRKPFDEINKCASHMAAKVCSIAGAFQY